MACAFHRECARQPEHTGLRRRIARLPEAAERPRHRGHVHDPAPLPFSHVRPHRLRAVERAGQVDAEVPLPELDRLVVELADVVERGGVVDEDVDRAELRDDAVDGGGDLLPVGHVTAQRERAAAHVADLVGGGLRVDHPLGPRGGGESAPAVGLLGRLGLHEDVGDRHVRARPRKRQRVRTPEPPRPPGDQGNAAGEVDLDRHVRSLIVESARCDRSLSSSGAAASPAVTISRSRPAATTWSTSPATWSDCTRPTRRPSTSRFAPAHAASTRPRSRTRCTRPGACSA